ncbi:Nop domain-containing protein, partial [Aureobasidium melanogenum]
MATIADELLNDFESDGEEENQESFEGDIATDSILRPLDHSDANGAMELDGDEEGDDEDGQDGDAAPATNVRETETEEEAKARVEKMNLAAVGDVRSVAILMKKLQPILEKIHHYMNLPTDQQTKNIGNIEDNPEYKLMTEANTYSTSIDGEIILVHKFIRDHYSTRFPELERLV